VRYLIYCDESGDVSFSQRSTAKYFSICTLTIDENKESKIENVMKRKRAKLYRLGWPKNIEIKASILHSMKFRRHIPQEVKQKVNGDKFIKEVLTSLKYSCSPRIDYIIVRKDRLTDPSFRSAPYGIAYNFFAGRVLIPLILSYKNCVLTVDRRNKEVHSQKHFDGYIETKAYDEAFEKHIAINLQIDHAAFDYGLQAVDFFSWSVYRRINRKDKSFFRIFEELVGTKQEWYCP
jgi:hypothetical protein